MVCKTYYLAQNLILWYVFCIQSRYFLKLVMMFFDNEIIHRDRNSKQCTRYILQCNVFLVLVIFSVSWYAKLIRLSIVCTEWAAWGAAQHNPLYSKEGWGGRQTNPAEKALTKLNLIGLPAHQTKNNCSCKSLHCAREHRWWGGGFHFCLAAHFSTEHTLRLPQNLTRASEWGWRRELATFTNSEESHAPELMLYPHPL